MENNNSYYLWMGRQCRIQYTKGDTAGVVKRRCCLLCSMTPRQITTKYNNVRWCTSTAELLQEQCKLNTRLISTFVTHKTFLVRFFFWQIVTILLFRDGDHFTGLICLRWSLPARNACAEVNKWLTLPHNICWLIEDCWLADFEKCMKLFYRWIRNSRAYYCWESLPTSDNHFFLNRWIAATRTWFFCWW